MTLTNLANIVTAANSDTTTTVIGSFDGAPDTLYTLEFFANTVANPSGYGEGERLLGTRRILTDDIGHDDYTFIFNTSVPAGQFVSATATDPDNTTWEFAADVMVNSAGGSAPSSRQNVAAVVALATGSAPQGQPPSGATNGMPGDASTQPLLQKDSLEGIFATGTDSSWSTAPNALETACNTRAEAVCFDLSQDLSQLLSSAVLDLLAVNLLH